MVEGLTIQTSVLKALLTSYAALALGFWLYHKFGRQFILKKRPFVVEKIERETPDVYALQLKATTKTRSKFVAGQYGYFMFTAPGFPKEYHPFSVSKMPKSDGTLTISVKELGDYTQRVSKIPAGSQVLVNGPYGKFNPKFTREFKKGEVKELAFVAGGIGIAPFFSLVEDFRTRGFPLKITLFVGAKTQKDLMRTNYLRKLSRDYENFSLVCCLSEDPSWVGHTGFIDRALLEKYVPRSEPPTPSQNTQYYVCGPKAMLDSVSEALLDMGVRERWIVTEKM